MLGSTFGSIVIPPLEEADEEELSGPEVPAEEAQEMRPHADELALLVSLLDAAESEAVAGVICLYDLRYEWRISQGRSLPELSLPVLDEPVTAPELLSPEPEPPEPPQP